MAITDYASLQTSVANWLHRTDLTALIPDFISLAESTMNGDVDSRSMESRATLTANTVNNLVALPTDMLEMRRLMITSTVPYRVLEYKSPEQLVADDIFVTQTQEPDSFTVIASNIEFNCIPDQAYTLECVYKQRIPALSNTNTTNWLITINPNVYLFGTLLAAAPYTQDEDRIAIWQKYYADAVQTVNSIDWYSGTGLRVRAR